MLSSSNRKYVLDTSAVLAGFLNTSASNDMYVTPLVIAEVKKKLGEEEASLLLDFRKLFVVEPLLETVNEILERIKKMGEGGNLSPADISVLALGVDINKSATVEIITDDYSIQNVATMLGLRVHSLATKPIRSTVLWEYRCKGCGKVYTTIGKNKICMVCGSEIIRRPIKKIKKGPRPR
ncbi:MAG: NOB1 family endonuclease [Conexivisphaerales archaeon]